MGDKLTTAELQKRFKVSRRTVQTWVKEGLPHSTEEKRTVRGRPANVFDIEDVQNWLIAQEKKGGIQRATESMEHKGVTITADTPEELTAIIDRLLKAERVTHEQWSRAVKTDGTAAAISVYQKNWQETVIALTKADKALREAMTKNGQLRNIAEIKRDVKRIGAVFKNEMLDLGALCRQEIIPYLRDEGDAGVVEDLVQEQARKYLERCVKKLTEA